MLGQSNYAIQSTLAAETVSLSSVLDQLSWIRLRWAWLLDSNVRWQTPESALRLLPQSFFTATVKDEKSQKTLWPLIVKVCLA